MGFYITYNKKEKVLRGGDESCLIRNDNRLKCFMDAESIDQSFVQSYMEYGFEEAVKLQDGPFAVVLFDKKTGELWVARDRLGAKQLYYGDMGDYIEISTHLSTQTGRTLEPDVNYAALQHYFTFSYVPEPMTIKNDVYALPRGHFMEMTGEELTPKRYNIWKPAPVESKDYEEFKLKVREALVAAVKRNLQGAKNPAAFLSGGLDSSILTAIAAKDFPNMTAYTIAFDVPGFSEAEVAANSAAYYGIKHEIIKVTPEDFKEAFEECVFHMSVPVADPSAVAVYLISKAAAGKCDVIISGEGSDELWGGYHIYNPYGKLLEVLDWSPSKKKFVWGIYKHLPDGTKNKALYKRGCQPLRERFVGNTFLCNDKELKKIMTPDAYNPKVKFTDVTKEVYDEAERDGLNDMDTMQFIDTTFFLTSDINIVAGKCTAGAGVRCVVPFMDNAVTDLARQLTKTDKLNGRQNKWVLREAFSDMITEEVRDGKKKGYPVPVRIWLSGELNDWAKEIIQNAAVLPGVNKEYALSLLDGCKANPEDQILYRKAWAVLVYAKWCELNKWRPLIL